MDITLRLDGQGVHAAGIRHVGPYTGLAPAFARISAWAGEHGLFGPNTRMLGVFWDDPRTTPPEKLRSDACISVGPDQKPDERAGVRIVDIPPGPEGVGVHVGPYDGIHAAYEAMYRWVHTEGHSERRGTAPFEVYLNDPRNTPPDQLRTELHLPVTPKT